MRRPYLTDFGIEWICEAYMAYYAFLKEREWSNPYPIHSVSIFSLSM